MSNPIQPDSRGLSWLDFFLPTIMGWVEKTLQPDPTQLDSCTPLIFTIKINYNPLVFHLTFSKKSNSFFSYQTFLAHYLFPPFKPTPYVPIKLVAQNSVLWIMYPIPMRQLEDLGFQQPVKSLFPVFPLILVKPNCLLPLVWALR